VSLSGSTSDSLGVSSQGFVYGPILFLINDLHLQLKHSEMDMFADDATCHSSETLNLKLQKGLDYSRMVFSSDMIPNADQTNSMSKSALKRPKITSMDQQILQLLDNNIELT
jgi:hypothetical protein